MIQKQVEFIFLDIQSFLTTTTTESMIHVQSNLKQLTGINQVLFSKLLVMKWFQLAQELCEKLQRDYFFSLSPPKTNSCQNVVIGINCLSCIMWLMFKIWVDRNKIRTQFDYKACKGSCNEQGKISRYKGAVD